jgi:RNA polymerase sigma factor (sigma-70 family)
MNWAATNHIAVGPPPLGVVNQVDVKVLLGVLAEGLQQYIESRLPKETQRIASSEDVFQIVCLEALEHAPGKTLRDIDDFAGWLLGVARHTIYAAVRYRAKSVEHARRGRTLPTWVERSASGRPLGVRTAEWPKTPSGAFRFKEVQVAVRQALEGLPDLQRRALEFRYVDGLPRKEIAELLGVPLGRLKRILEAAKAAARKALGDPSNFIN